MVCFNKKVNKFLLFGWKRKRRVKRDFWETVHLPLPKANINTYFSLRAKWWLRGRVGGQFPRNLIWCRSCCVPRHNSTHDWDFGEDNAAASSEGIFFTKTSPMSQWEGDNAFRSWFLCLTILGLRLFLPFSTSYWLFAVLQQIASLFEDHSVKRKQSR